MLNHLSVTTLLLFGGNRRHLRRHKGYTTDSCQSQAGQGKEQEGASPCGWGLGLGKEAASAETSRGDKTSALLEGSEVEGQEACEQSRAEQLPPPALQTHCPPALPNCCSLHRPEGPALPHRRDAPCRPLLPPAMATVSGKAAQPGLEEMHTCRPTWVDAHPGASSRT